ncbi:MAG TPA: hypothetical protein DCQ31_01975, partial [Bacteroidales bacterium]|nr:hypothetical protein [Bacteroidales bacterium]
PPVAFPVLEIDLEGDPDGIQTVQDKKHAPRQKICPAVVSPELALEMQKLSIKAFNALQLRDFARVDIRMDENNRIFLLEINSMASLGVTGSYVFAAEKFGLNYTQLVNKMLEVAVKRYFANSEKLYEDNFDSSGKNLPVRVRTYVRSVSLQVEAYLKQWVDINTFVRNIDGVNRMGKLISKEIKKLGFKAEVFPQVEIGNSLFFTNAKNQPLDVLLLGNLDNDTEVSNHQYFKINDKQWSGTGIWTNKGGLTVLLLALSALEHSEVLSGTKIGILLTTDDSLQGKLSKKLIHQKSLHAKHVIGLQGAELQGGIITSRSGSAIYSISLHLRETDNEENVARVVIALNKLVAAWTSLTDLERGIFVSPGEMNLSTNITNPYASAKLQLNVKFNRNSDLIEIDKRIRKLVPKTLKNLCSIQFDGGEQRPAM